MRIPHGDAITDFGVTLPDGDDTDTAKWKALGVRVVDRPPSLLRQTAEAVRAEGYPVPEQVCPHCDGKGHLPLEPFLLSVWYALDEKEPQTEHELAAKCRDTQPAVRYRLHLLKSRGLARAVGHRPAPKRGKPQPLWVRTTLEVVR